MEKLQHAPAFLRKRKMMMALPLLVLPFVTLAFWALGGGKGAISTAVQNSNDSGLNLRLPGASLKPDKALDKMDYYEKADVDSARLKAQIKDDPYFRLETNLALDTTHASTRETKVYDKLKQINAAVENARVYTAPASARGNSANEAPVREQNAGRLEKMMYSMKHPEEGVDSEMLQINAMLEKVMDIQHPERLNEKYKQQAFEQKGAVFAVIRYTQDNTGFYSATTSGEEDSTTISAQLPNAIEAVVHETQTLVNGATIKLRLLTGVIINGISVPKDNFIYGTVSLTGERLTIVVNSIRYQNALLPVDLSVYDMDGMAGVHIPGAITRDVAKQSTDNALQSVALNSLDPSIGVQAASAGIETAKTFISKKVKLVRVTVKAGYHVLLKDKKNE